ncbi:MAG TPA: L-ribulose-5-phosphate 4-epimerase AraD [Phycisphaerae bacterium]|nr:L-ribulose-5-phosphate 4-epimerase AraD [Phycisphaerae bacterium]
MLEELKQLVCEANRKLVEEGLVVQTFGNVSGVDRDGGHLVIKPSGVAYDELTPERMVVVSLESGEPVEGLLRPSSDTPTHRVLYGELAGIGGIVHTHSLCATAWAQARREIPPFGTTHADYFFGPVPCTRVLTDEEIGTDYEANTGRVIAERFADLDVASLPGVLVASHGPFAWGASPEEAVHNAVVLEHLARLAAATVAIDPYPKAVSFKLLEKHYLRKHGPGAYYGQK